jgi:hypothetical protein
LVRIQNAGAEPIMAVHPVGDIRGSYRDAHAIIITLPAGPSYQFLSFHSTSASICDSRPVLAGLLVPAHTP